MAGLSADDAATGGTGTEMLIGKARFESLGLNPETEVANSTRNNVRQGRHPRRKRTADEYGLERPTRLLTGNSFYILGTLPGTIRTFRGAANQMAAADTTQQPMISKNATR